MHYVGYLSLLAAFFLALFFCASILWNLFKSSPFSKDLSKYHLFILVLIGISCLILFYAFFKRDFSFLYVYSYTDKNLKWYYALSAFWAGQEGSLLLWLFFISFCAFLWTKTSWFKRLDLEEKNYFWLFLLPIEIFFLSLLITTINPFIKQIPVPQDGLGLNPLLQHPAMVFHPPFLFLGYSGFAISCCAALAGWLKDKKTNWIFSTRGWMLIFWSFLTAGILLGCWWSYMELGWGGYWAWDPVENSSLIPWILCSSFLHISSLVRKRKVFINSSFLLDTFIFISCILGTFFTRSGFLESLHTFSESKVGMPILAFLIFYILLVLVVFFIRKDSSKNEPPSLFSKDGIIIILNWIFLFLAFAVLLGTTWPVLSSLFYKSKNVVGSEFFNKTCLPLFSLVIFLIGLCFSFNINKWLFFLFFVFVEVILWVLHIKNLLVLFSIGSCVSSFVIFLILAISNYFKKRWEVLGMHLGLLIVAVGITLSSGYKYSQEVSLKPKQKVSVKEFLIEFKDYDTKFTKNTFLFESILLIKKGEKILGVLKPYKKIFRNHEAFSKVETLSMFFNELYVVILDFDIKGTVILQVSLHPFVNWFWFGGSLICLFSLIYGIRIFRLNT